MDETLHTGDCLFDVIEDSGCFWVRATDDNGNRGVTRVFPTSPVRQRIGYEWHEVIGECQIAESEIAEPTSPDFMSIAHAEIEGAL